VFKENRSEFARLEASVDRALQRIEQARRKAEQPGSQDERIEVARSTLDKCITVFAPLRGALSMVKAGYERAFEQQQRQLAGVNEHHNQLSTMRDVIAKDTRQSEAANKQAFAHVSKMQQFCEGSDSGQTLDAQLSSALTSQQQRSVKKNSLIEDMKLAARALEAADQDFKTRYTDYNRVDLGAKRAHIEAQCSLTLEEIRMVRADMVSNKTQQDKYNSIKFEKQLVIDELDTKLRQLQPQNEALTSKVKQLEQLQALRKMVRYSGDVVIRSCVRDWAESVPEAQVVEMEDPNEASFSRTSSSGVSNNNGSIEGFNRRASVNPSRRKSVIVDILKK